MKKILCACLIALAMPTSLVWANVGEAKPAANQADPDFVAGKRAVKAKDWKAAIEAFGKVIASKPDSADAHNYLGYSHRQLDQLEQSFTHYNEALRIDPNHRGANEYIGQAYLRVGKPEKAAEHLARLEKFAAKIARSIRISRARLLPITRISPRVERYAYCAGLPAHCSTASTKTPA